MSDADLGLICGLTFLAVLLFNYFAYRWWLSKSDDENEVTQ